MLLTLSFDLKPWYSLLCHYEKHRGVCWYLDHLECNMSIHVYAHTCLNFFESVICVVLLFCVLSNIDYQVISSKFVRLNELYR